MRQLIVVQPELRQGWQRTDVWRLQKNEINKKLSTGKICAANFILPTNGTSQDRCYGPKNWVWPEKGFKVKNSGKTAISFLYIAINNTTANTSLILFECYIIPLRAKRVGEFIRLP